MKLSSTRVALPQMKSGQLVWSVPTKSSVLRTLMTAYCPPFPASVPVMWGHDTHSIVGIAGDGSGGYWLLDSCGGIFTFGSLPFYGSSITC